MLAITPDGEWYTDKETPLSVGLILHLIGIAHTNIVENFQAKLAVAVPIIATDLFPFDLSLCPMDDPSRVSLNLLSSSSLFRVEDFFFLIVTLVRRQTYHIQKENA